MSNLHFKTVPTLQLHAAKHVGLQGVKANAKKLINGLQLISHWGNVGNAKTLAISPAFTTHKPLSEAVQLAAGLAPN
ncbi:MAG: PLP-dependent transferase [Flavobacterium sp.]|nr:PLP-dependent transferase [Flavobacterium sp.]